MVSHFNMVFAGMPEVNPAIVDQRFDYNVDATVLYAGVAPAGEEAGGKWTIRKFTYITVDSQSVISLSQTAIGSWNERASLFS